MSQNSAAQTLQTAPVKHRCGVCQSEGHNARTCPLGPRRIVDAAWARHFATLEAERDDLKAQRDELVRLQAAWRELEQREPAA